MSTTIITSTKGLTSSIYRILSSNIPIHDTTISKLKQKWETDLGCTYDDPDWHNLLERSQMVLVSTKHRLMQFNIFHRVYYTPLRLHKMNGDISAMCPRCKVVEGDLLHMLWSCPHLDNFWRFIISTVSEIIETEIPQDPRLWILGDVSLININSNKEYFLTLTATAAKKVILVNWKSDKSPSQRHWLNELSSYCTPEKNTV